ncbi:MAG: SDR family oxidoreductase [Acidimicrobiia bacterium]|jgi:enoyl-[acyl-carrier protein] reductase III
MTEYRPLAGKVALITGGSRGLGAATARHLSRWGARVIITYRQNSETAEEVVAACSELTPGARAIQMDLVDEESVRAVFASLGEDRLDFLIANAAATALRPLLALKMHQIDKTFAITVRHFILMVQLAFPLLERTGGRIVAISGADTVGYIPTHGLLGAAKSSMETLVRYLAAELGPSGVTAVGILPGYIDTDSIRMMTGPLYEPLKQAEIETHPLREAATAEDAAEAVALMCLPEAKWLNGQIVHNDGGGLYAMQGRFFQAAAQAAGASPGEDSPIVGL